MSKFKKIAIVTRRGKNNQGSNLLTKALAERQAKKDMKKARKSKGAS